MAVDRGRQRRAQWHPTTVIRGAEPVLETLEQAQGKGKKGMAVESGVLPAAIR